MMISVYQEFLKNACLGLLAVVWMPLSSEALTVKVTTSPTVASALSTVTDSTTGPSASETANDVIGNVSDAAMHMKTTVRVAISWFKVPALASITPPMTPLAFPMK